MKTSSFKDHTSTEMHKKAMDLLKKSESNYSIQATSIAKALHRIDSATLHTMRKNLILLIIFIARKGLPFTKMAPLCQLEERHGINLGAGYKQNQASAQFVKFIAMIEQQNLAEVLSKAHFLAFKLMVAQTVSPLNKNCICACFFILVPLTVECMCVIYSLLSGSLKLQILKVYIRLYCTSLHGS